MGTYWGPNVGVLLELTKLFLVFLGGTLRMLEKRDAPLQD
jgi:hypothetical protein